MNRNNLCSESNPRTSSLFGGYRTKSTQGVREIRRESEGQRNKRSLPPPPRGFAARLSVVHFFIDIGPGRGALKRTHAS